MEHRLVSRREIVEAVNRAEATYHRCWDVLGQLSSGDWSAGFPERLVSFQGTLGDCLFALSQLRKKVETEKRRLINRKSAVLPSWFKRRMEALSKYSAILKEVIKTGRRTGDNFAWFFYQQNRNLLKKHLTHDDNGQIPTGIGGIGELEFARQFQIFKGKLVIYHGITTFLRVGDASLYDFSKREIVALLELKTKQIASDRILISVFHYGGSKAGGTAAEFVQSGMPGELDLNPKQKSRLARQLERMEGLLEPVTKPNRHVISGSLHIEALERLADRSKRHLAAYQVAGDGLLLVAIRRPGRSLASRLFAEPPSRASLDRRLGALGQWFERIRKRDSRENYLLPGELDPGVGQGIVPPMLWWGIDCEFIRDVTLGRVIVHALYNPVFFIEKLREAGFGVRLGGPAPHLRVWRERDGIRATISGMDQVVGSVQKRLFHEEAVLAILTTSFEKGTMEKAQQVVVEVELHFGEAREAK